MVTENTVLGDGKFGFVEIQYTVLQKQHQGESKRPHSYGR